MERTKREKIPTLDEVIKIFSEPDMLRKTLKKWSEAEPKSMKEVLDNLPNPTVKEVIRSIT